MTKRDDDPPHPDWNGIVFNAATDRKGIVVTPSTATTLPPYTYVLLASASIILGDLRAVIHGIESQDTRSYFAHFLRDIADDLADAISFCEAPHAPPPEG